MMKHAAFVSLLALCWMTDLCRAQDQQRAGVSAALNMSALQPGQQGAIAVVLDIKPGFHAQSHTPKGENFIPTEVLVTDAASVSAYAPIYPAGKDEFYPA